MSEHVHAKVQTTSRRSESHVWERCRLGDGLWGGVTLTGALSKAGSRAAQQGALRQDGTTVTPRSEAAGAFWDELASLPGLTGRLRVLGCSHLPPPPCLSPEPCLLPLPIRKCLFAAPDPVWDQLHVFLTLTPCRALLEDTCPRTAPGRSPGRASCSLAETVFAYVTSLDRKPPGMRLPCVSLWTSSPASRITDHVGAQKGPSWDLYHGRLPRLPRASGPWGCLYD